MEKQFVSSDRDEQRLYELIWKRTVASQMADAKLEKTTVEIGVSTVKEAAFVAEGEVLKFDGFLKVYLESKDDEDDDLPSDRFVDAFSDGDNQSVPLLFLPFTTAALSPERLAVIDFPQIPLWRFDVFFPERTYFSISFRLSGSPADESPEEELHPDELPPMIDDFLFCFLFLLCSFSF